MAKHAQGPGRRQDPGEGSRLGAVLTEGAPDRRQDPGEGSRLGAVLTAGAPDRRQIPGEGSRLGAVLMVVSRQESRLSPGAAQVNPTGTAPSSSR